MQQKDRQKRASFPLISFSLPKHRIGKQRMNERELVVGRLSCEKMDYLDIGLALFIKRILVLLPPLKKKERKKERKKEKTLAELRYT